MTELTIEQRFNLKAFEHTVSQLSHEQSKEMLVKMYEQMIVREAICKELVRKEWGL
jgi:hypothetical protein